MSGLNPVAGVIKGHLSRSLWFEFCENYFLLDIGVLAARDTLNIEDLDRNQDIQRRVNGQKAQ